MEKGEPSYRVEESYTLKEYMYPKVHFSTIYNSQYMETTLMYMEEWIKMWYICTMEYFSVIKKDGLIPFAAIWIDLEIVLLSEVRQKKTNVTWYHSYGEVKEMVPMNLFTKQKLIHRWRTQTFVYNTNVVIKVKDKERDKIGDWDWHILATIYVIDN